MKSCLDCHFLVKTGLNVHMEYETNPWADYDRDEMALFDESCKPGCFKGVWQLENQPDQDEKLTELVMTDREECDFFFEYQEGMTLDTAGETQRLRKLDRQNQKSLKIARGSLDEARQSRKTARTAMWIAFASLIASAIFNVIVNTDKLKWW